MPTVRTPEAPCRRSPSRDPRCCLPLWEMGSATPITIDFGAIFPFTCVPAYSFPVYASQRPLPDATQDSVRGCWLGFAAVAIPGACASRAFKAQLPHHRAYGSVHGGSSAPLQIPELSQKVQESLGSPSTRQARRSPRVRRVTFLPYPHGVSSTRACHGLHVSQWPIHPRRQSTDQSAIIGGPVLDVVLCLVRGMDSRLHPSSLVCPLATCGWRITTQPTIR